MKDSKNVILTDLNYICKNTEIELLELSGNRLLITGGAGFLGYYLVKTILHWNNSNSHKPPIELVIYDNFMRGVPKWLDSLYGGENINIEKYDVTDPLPQNMGDFDYIIHAATIASPIYYRLHPIKTMDANINGLRHLLDYCRDQKEKKRLVKGFLFYSTSEIYGDPTPENIPTPETYRGNVSCTGPRACYDESKRYGETLCVNFTQKYDLPVRIVRPFNNYGPGLKISDRRAIPDLANNILKKEDILLYSDGSPSRTFCYVADAMVGYFKALVKGRNGESYNIGSDKPEITILQLAEEIVEISRKIFGYDGKIIFGDSTDKNYLTDNPNRRCPIIEKAEKQLGYKPRIKLNEGLERSLIWYSDNRFAENM